MFRTRIAIRLFALAASALALSACATTTKTVATSDAPDYDGPRLNKILVIGVADSYENRTQYERRLASELRQAGTSAMAYFVIAGGNTPIVREEIENLATNEGFEGVLVSRVTNRESDAAMKSGPAGAKATRRSANDPLDLFRYDYEELNEPEMLDINLNMTILTELYSLPSGNKVWSVETSVSDVKTLVEVINNTSDAVVARLRADGLIGD